MSDEQQIEEQVDQNASESVHENTDQQLEDAETHDTQLSEGDDKKNGVSPSAEPKTQEPKEPGSPSRTKFFQLSSPVSSSPVSKRASVDLISTPVNVVTEKDAEKTSSPVPQHLSHHQRMQQKKEQEARERVERALKEKEAKERAERDAKEEALKRKEKVASGGSETTNKTSASLPATTASTATSTGPIPTLGSSSHLLGTNEWFSSVTIGSFEKYKSKEEIKPMISNMVIMIGKDVPLATHYQVRYLPAGTPLEDKLYDKNNSSPIPEFMFDCNIDVQLSRSKSQSIKSGYYEIRGALGKRDKELVALLNDQMEYLHSMVITSVKPQYSNHDNRPCFYEQSETLYAAIRVFEGGNAKIPCMVALAYLDENGKPAFRNLDISNPEFTSYEGVARVAGRMSTITCANGHNKLVFTASKIMIRSNEVKSVMGVTFNSSERKSAEDMRLKSLESKLTDNQAADYIKARILVATLLSQGISFNSIYKRTNNMVGNYENISINKPDANTLSIHNYSGNTEEDDAEETKRKEHRANKAVKQSKKREESSESENENAQEDSEEDDETLIGPGSFPAGNRNRIVDDVKRSKGSASRNEFVHHYPDIPADVKAPRTRNEFTRR